VILSRKPALVYASSGNPGRTYPLSRDPDSLFSAARDAGAKYLLLDHLDQISSTYLVPALIQRPRGFCVIRSLGADRATLFGIVAGADTLKDARPDPGAADVAVSFSQCDDRARAVELHRVNLLYTIVLKHLPVVDLVTVASGYLIRVYAGAVAVGVPLSVWMGSTTVFLSLFLVSSKR
jgi:hypothetical protein